MKDHLMKTIHCGKNVRIHFYKSYQTQVVFVGHRCRMHFQFGKDDDLLYSFQTTPHGKGATNKDKASNWKSFKEYAAKHEKDQLPARFRRLARWRFDNPPRYGIVEEQIGCIIYFRKGEIS